MGWHRRTGGGKSRRQVRGHVWEVITTGTVLPSSPWRRRSTEFPSSRTLPGRSSDMRSSTAWVAHPMNTGPIRSRSPLIEIYTSASGFTWTRAHGNPALVPAPEPADRVGVAPERPDAAARPPDAGSGPASSTAERRPRPRPSASRLDAEIVASRVRHESLNRAVAAGAVDPHPPPEPLGYPGGERHQGLRRGVATSSRACGCA